MLAINKQVVGYGIALGLLAVLLKWLELQFVITNNRLELYGGFIAVIFTGRGIWLNVKLRNAKANNLGAELPIAATEFAVNAKELHRLNLSRRELEVLQLMARGLSNQEIADQLFISLNTVKTHTAQIFVKMEVKRRTQAIDVAKRLGLIS